LKINLKVNKKIVKLYDLPDFHRGCEAEPCPCNSDSDNHTECREDTAADHTANGHRPRRVEAEH
ncbi:MAG: hypothetical protein WBG61_05230, partial [Desulfobacterales bacterium]